MRERDNIDDSEGYNIPNFNFKLTLEDHRNLHRCLRHAVLNKSDPLYGSCYLLPVYDGDSHFAVPMSRDEWCDVAYGGYNETLTGHLAHTSRSYIVNFFGRKTYQESEGRFYYEAPSS